MRNNKKGEAVTIAVIAIALIGGIIGLLPKISGGGGDDRIDAPVQLPAQSQVERLIERPDFVKAARNAPQWVKDALDTVLRLEKELILERTE